MKRLLAVVVLVAFFALPASAQRGGSHGGFSGSHGGFSGSHGFSGAGGSVSHGSFGGFRGSAPGRVASPPSARFAAPPSRRFASPPSTRFAGPSRYISNRMPYRGPTLRPVAPRTRSIRQPYAGSSHTRMPYDGNFRRRDWDHDRDHHRGRGFGFAGLYGWAGYPYLPWWGWGDPYMFNDWDYGDDYDSQPASNSTNWQYPENPPYSEDMPGAYDQQSADQAEPEQPAYTPWPYSRPAPSTAPAQSAVPAQPAPAPDSTVTLVFKDGRPNEQIHNYLLTATTLSVLDQHHRDIPVDQIDVAATARLNREAGVDFNLPAFAR